MNPFYRKFLKILSPVLETVFLLAAAFFVGHFTAMAQNHFAPVSAVLPSSDWGLSFQENGQAPVANTSAEELAKYNAYYLKPTEEKK